MKRLIISTLSTLAISSLFAPAFANEAELTKTSTASINRITPFALVSGAYQGRLRNQGVPGSANFLAKVRSNKITAETLVEAAIANRRLEADAISDQKYLSTVDSLLGSFDRL